ncbi:MAG: endo-1,4-beta-xylanase [Planctomycetaceae bacterium]|nr:endo-1,4-beta-xylanase [Planctomycetaceae bacterium]
MGVMRFTVHPPDLLEGLSATDMLYISGMDGRIYPTRGEWSDGVLACRRPLSDSGKLTVPFPHNQRGYSMLTSTSLREREEPYLLMIELARGALSSLRDQWAAWEMGHMAIPQVFRDLQSSAFSAFASACASQSDVDRACELARNAIEDTRRAANVLVDAYVIQRMTSLRRNSHLPTGLLGCALDPAALESQNSEFFLSAFTAAAIPISWKSIEPHEGNYHWDLADDLVEFAQQNRSVIKGGPLIELDDGGLPEWLAPWKNDLLNLPSFVCDYIETAINRYTGKVRIWDVSDFGNTGQALDLSEEHRLALVARTLEAAHRTDSDAQFFIGIDQPWGEYQRKGNHRLSPMQFADALVRSNLGLAGVTLHINTGYNGPATFPREMIQISRLIDLWSLLGIQIHVKLGCPSSPRHDPLADPRLSVNEQVGEEPWCEEAQSEWIERIVPLLLAKPAVTGVFIENFSDQHSHRFPHAGLLGADGHPKCQFAPLRRQKHQDLT